MERAINRVGVDANQIEVCPQVGQRLVPITGMHDEAVKANGIPSGQVHTNKRLLVL
jgi:hypothetical protein